MLILIQKNRKRKNETEKDEIIDHQKAKIRKLKRQLQLVKNQNASLMDGKLPKTVKKKVAKELLIATEKYSKATVTQMLKPIKTKGVGKGPYRGPRCNSWDDDDYGNGFKFKRVANKKVYQYARKVLHVPLVGPSGLDKKYWWMHINPPWIMSVLEYLTIVTPEWHEYEKHVIFCWDEIYVCTDCDVDLILDMAVNPECQQCVQIGTIRGIVSGWYLPFYVKGNHAITTGDVNETIAKIQSAGLYPLAILMDQGASNRALAPQLGISTYTNKAKVDLNADLPDSNENGDGNEDRNENVKGKKKGKKKEKKKKKNIQKPNPRDFIHYFENPFDPDKLILWIWDIVHLMKSLRTNLLKSKVTLPDGSIVSVDDLWDLLDKVKSNVGMEHTSCFHLTPEHLLVESSDLQVKLVA